MSDLPYLNGREIYECANQLEGYVDKGTPERLAAFLMREGKAANDLADEIVRLRAALDEALEVVKPFADCETQSEIETLPTHCFRAARRFYEKHKGGGDG
jgi:hypothetical protein